MQPGPRSRRHDPVRPRSSRLAATGACPGAGRRKGLGRAHTAVPAQSLQTVAPWRTVLPLVGPHRHVSSGEVRRPRTPPPASRTCQASGRAVPWYPTLPQSHPPVLEPRGVHGLHWKQALTSICVTQKLRLPPPLASSSRPRPDAGRADVAQAFDRLSGQNAGHISGAEW